MDDHAFMKLALAEAARALEMGEIPVGALIVKGKEILGRGCNRRQADNAPLAHAEILALTDAAKRIGNWRFDRCTLFVTLEPCVMCAGAIVQSRVARVVYGACDPRAGACGSLYDILRDPRMYHYCQVRGGVLADESAELLRRFFHTRRRGR